MQEQGEFTARALRRGQPAGQIPARERGDLLELLRELPTHGHWPIPQVRERCRHRFDAMRCFQQQDRSRFTRQRLHSGIALTGLGRQEPTEHERAAFSCRTRRAEQSRDAAGTGNRHDAMSGLPYGRGQPGTRIAHGRRAGIARIRHAPPFPQLRNDAGCRLHLIVLMQSEEAGRRCIDAIRAQHGLRMTRVFARDRVGDLQDMQRAQRNVGEVADRRGDDVERALRIMLRGRRLAGCDQSRRKRSAQ